MLFPLAVALVAVALGAWMALGAEKGARYVRPLRSVAMVAALAVIAVHLLPEAFHEIGPWAAAPFVAGVVLPWLAEVAGALIAKRREGEHPPHAGHEHPRHGHAAALEIGYAGLLLHRFGDGLSMGAAMRSSSSFASGAGVVLAVAAHIVPVSAVMLLGFLDLRGRGSVFRRASGLAAGTGAGVIAASLALENGPSDAAPWVSAVVAGLLLHIVAHDVPRPGVSEHA